MEMGHTGLEEKRMRGHESAAWTGIPHSQVTYHIHNSIPAPAFTMEMQGRSCKTSWGRKKKSCFDLWIRHLFRWMQNKNWLANLLQHFMFSHKRQWTEKFFSKGRALSSKYTYIYTSERGKVIIGENNMYWLLSIGQWPSFLSGQKLKRKMTGRSAISKCGMGAWDRHTGMDTWFGDFCSTLQFLPERIHHGNGNEKPRTQNDMTSWQ